MSKEVKKSAKNEKFLLHQLKLGLNPSRISKKYNIKKQNLNYYLRKLKEKGMIKKVGYGVWEVKEVKIFKQGHPKKQVKKQVRGHAFIWKIKVPKEAKGYNYLDRLTQKKIKFKIVGTLKFPRIVLNNRKIWLGNKNIVIFEPFSFFSIDSINARKLAIYKLLETLKKLENKLAINLEPYKFTPRREHYSLVKNQLAIQCNKTGEKIYISDKDGLWLCVDNSYNLNELETLGKKSLVTNKQLQDWWNSHKKTKFEVTPEFTLKMLNGLAATQVMNAENIIKHQKVLDEMLTTLKKIQKNYR